MRCTGTGESIRTPCIPRGNAELWVGGEVMDMDKYFPIDEVSGASAHCCCSHSLNTETTVSHWRPFTVEKFWGKEEHFETACFQQN